MKKLILLFFTLYFLSGCFKSGNIADERAEKSDLSKGDICIGAVAPWKKVTDKGNLNWYGIELAYRNINSKGGLLGRKIKIIKKDDEASVNRGIEVAQEFADDPDIVAVIGHAYSFITIPASVIYEFSGLVMISPAASSPKLTQRNFKLVFRVIPNDNDMGSQLAEYAFNKGLKKMMIYCIKDEYGLSLANAFEKRAEELDIEILDRLSYDSVTRKSVFYNDFKKWDENYKFDAVFLVARNPVEGATIIKEARKAQVVAPFISGDSLNSKRLIDIGGKAVEGTVVPSNFNPDDNRSTVKNFIKEFEKTFQKSPDSWAALYYDAANVLFYAIKKAGTTNPVKIAKALHSIKNFNGVTGKFSFKKNGDVTSKRFFMKHVKNGKFEIVK